MKPPVAADFLWSYRCNGKGCCCKSGWRIGLVAEDLAHFDAAAEEGPLARRLARLGAELRASPFRPLLADSGGRGRRPELADLPKRDDGVCVMLADDDLCDIHRHLGEDALPRACQAFPVLVGETPGGIGTAWEVLCPEVAHALADATRPAQLTSPPDGPVRAFVPDPWLAAPKQRPSFGSQTIDADSEWHFRATLAQRLAEAPDDPLRPLAAALAELLGCEEGAATIAVVEMLRRRALGFGADRDRMRRLVRLCRGFFQHHRWGGASPLDALGEAIGRGDGPLNLDPHCPDAAGRLVLTNAAIAHQTLAPHDSPGLATDVARTILILGDACVFRALPGTPGQMREAERMATSVALAETLHRGTDAGLAAFAADLFAIATSFGARDAARRRSKFDDLPSAIADAVARSRRRIARETQATAGWLGGWVAYWRRVLGLPTPAPLGVAPPEAADMALWPLVDAADAPLATLLFTLATDPAAAANAGALPHQPDWSEAATRLAAQGFVATSVAHDPMTLAATLDRRLVEAWLADPGLTLALATG